MVGETLAAEHIQYVDEMTGLSVTRWTGSPAKDQHFYFTSMSVTRDDRWLVFISERDGNPNLYAIDRSDGSILKLSDNRSGLLQSYVYPQGGNCGISKSSPCLDPNFNRVYWVQDDRVMRYDLNAMEAGVVADLPAGWIGAFNHVSPDGCTICVPCTDPRAFASGLADQWAQCRSVPSAMADDPNLVTQILRIDTQSGHVETWATVSFWVTHVQYDPKGSGRLIFNKEGFAEVRPRIWCMESEGQPRPLAEYPAGEIWSHENWSSDGSCIVYHGWNERGVAFFAARTWEGELLVEQEMPQFKQGHVTITADGRSFILDGIDGFVTLATPEDTVNESATVAAGLSLTHLCKHDTDPSLRDQDAHVHASPTPNGRSIIFTSDREGSCNVYEVELPGAG